MLLGGVMLCAYSSQAIKRTDGFRFEPNPFGIKQSPYGKVISTSLQGPVDIDWHIMQGCPLKIKGCPMCEAHDERQRREDAMKSPLGRCISQAQQGVVERTNPNPLNTMHKLYLRQEMQDKLKFAYELDPANYANYNIYNLFLTIGSLRTKDVAESAVIALAEQTIDYGLNDASDPRSYLTAASAASNALEIILRDNSGYAAGDARRFLDRMEESMSRYAVARERWLAAGLWENLSEARRTELEERCQFNQKILADVRMCVLRMESAENALAPQ